MRASVKTWLPLDTWAAIIGTNPLHASQVTTSAMQNTVCSSIWKQFAWQHNDMVSREDIAQAIADAEAMIAEQMGYSLLPDWQVAENQPLVRPHDQLNRYSGYGGGLGFGNGYGYGYGGAFGGLSVPTVQLDQAHFISGGIEAKTLIEAGTAVVYTDANGDGYPETATVTVALPAAVTDPAEVALYYPGESGADDWEIHPFRSITITAGVATIVLWRHQLPLPELMDALEPEAIDGDVDANFLAEVDCYRHWNDPQQQVQLIWHGGGGWCGCADGGCAACTVGAQWGCLSATDPRQSIVRYQPATWDADAEAFAAASWIGGWGAPHRIRAWYYAGYQAKGLRYPTLQMDGALARAVTYLSLTLLDRTICACNNVESLVKHWRDDMALNDSSSVGSTSYQVAQRVLENPFGSTRGALFAWNLVSRDGRTLGRAVNL